MWKYLKKVFSRIVAMLLFLTLTCGFVLVAILWLPVFILSGVDLFLKFTDLSDRVSEKVRVYKPE